MSLSLRTSLITFAIVATSSLFFCSKAIFVKLAYRYDLDAVTVLALRMAIALPFFLIGGYLNSRSRKNDTVPLTGKDWLHLAALGFCGWYLSSVVNFIGLQHVSVSLERMILYTYPSLVVIGSVLFLGKPMRARIIIAMLVSYLGIVIAYQAEATSHLGQNNNTLLGATLIFISAVTYAIFVLLSGQMVKRIGPTRFTSCVVGFSAVFVLIHFALTHPISALTNLPPGAYGCGVLLAILGTVIPSYLFGIGIQRAGSQAFAIIGMIGPLGTVVLAWFLLGETINPIQVLGLLLTLAGGVAVSLVKS
ncbi:hypothetical protein FEM03_09565 [Phragmitibacter flavus]|uniref:EamA domain-containing protein n=1 Tax=Phragmitibacter flavus TaxID=2576071 RepID=A0A5R8KFR8_9BACT|nr:DMT family transporter [Phragmitibacter flavus]TLD71147.1 hypothetical protein FEM03_09565 [Phragmitibacter flavus]